MQSITSLFIYVLFDIADKQSLTAERSSSCFENAHFRSVQTSLKKPLTNPTVPYLIKTD